MKHFHWGERLRPYKKCKPPSYPSRKPLNSPIFKFCKFRKFCRKTRSRWICDRSLRPNIDRLLTKRPKRATLFVNLLSFSYSFCSKMN
jgi:hypothetical protein